MIIAIMREIKSSEITKPTFKLSNKQYVIKGIKNIMDIIRF